MKILFAVLLMAATVSVSNLALAAETQTDLNAVETTVNGHYQIAGNWSELKRGWNDLLLQVTDSNRKPVVGAKVTIDYEMVGMPMFTPAKPVEDQGKGTYKKRVFPSMRGTWKFVVQISASGTEDTLTHFQDVM